MSPREELNAERIAELVAKEFGMNPADMSYQWHVNYETDEFLGVIVFGAAKRPKGQRGRA